VSAPAEILLRQLLERYESEHSSYIQRWREFRTWWNAAVVATIAAPLVFGIYYLLDGSEIFLHFPEVLILGLGIPLMASGGIWLKQTKLRKELQRLKTELDDIGYYIICDSENRFNPRLKLLDKEPHGEELTVFPRFQIIDFKIYDRLFDR
jgi:hypothetical protein